MQGKWKGQVMAADKNRARLVLGILFCALAADCASGRVIYVDKDGGGPGGSWERVYRHLGEALEAACAGDEVRVAQGTYKPHEGASADGLEDWERSFRLKGGVTLKGGYAGVGAADPNARDVGAYETILSGDLLGNDVWQGEVYNVGYAVEREDNSEHVVVGVPGDDVAVLDGVVITAGHADLMGGGIFAEECHMIVRNCTFTLNWGGPREPRSTFPGYQGGAIRFRYGSLLIEDSVFRGNAAGMLGGAVDAAYCDVAMVRCSFVLNWTFSRAGGVHIDSCEASRIEESTFKGNSCTYDGRPWPNTGRNRPSGGAILNTRTNTDIHGCLFIGNAAVGGKGGALVCPYESRLLIENSVFLGNTAQRYGGVLFVPAFNELTLRNCTLAGNRAEAGALLASDGYPGDPNTVVFENSILWNGQGWLFDPNGLLDVRVSHSTVQGGWPGHGNIDADPCFASCGYWEDSGTPADMNDDTWVMGDYHLRSQAGRWDPNASAWVQDDVTSPCIDRGSIESPIGWEPFANGGIVNMGYYGGTAEASKSWFGEPPCETVMAGDINGDCAVDWRDFGFFGAHWLDDHVPPYPPTAPASSPFPADGAQDVGITTSLVWERSRFATSYDVYLGPNDPPEFAETVGDSSFDACDLEYSMLYYWRVDANGPGGQTQGPVWQFSTGADPLLPSNPSPRSGAMITRGNSVQLSWTAGQGAVSHDVYFGRTAPPAFQGNQTETTFDAGDLPEFGWYFWRVVEVRPDGQTQGPLWRFEYSGGGGGGGGAR